MISDKLKKMILRVLELDDCEIVDSTTASEVPGWDSLNHIKVICAVEEAFHVRFKTAEILRLRNIGELQQLIDLNNAR